MKFFKQKGKGYNNCEVFWIIYCKSYFAINKVSCQAGISWKLSVALIIFRNCEVLLEIKLKSEKKTFGQDYPLFSAKITHFDPQMMFALGLHTL